MASKAAPLSETHPEVADRWCGNVKELDKRTPEQFSVKARLECWWWCGNVDHEQFAAVPGEHLHSFRCPHCAADWVAEYERIMAQPVAWVPELVAAWRDKRSYDGLRVRDLCGGVMAQNFGRTFSLRCPANHKLDTVVRRFVTVGCPWCRGNETRHVPKRSVRDADPELAAIWHPTKNGEMTPENTPVNYRKPLWWKSVQCCGHEWEQDMVSRTLGRRPQAGRGHYYCPVCESVWGSLAWLDPELATEWHPDNELTPWHVKPFSADVVVRWSCSADPSHEWAASVIARSSGRLCPHCSTAGTSQIEQAFLAAAQAVDPTADTAILDRWRVDVFVPSVGLVIEYDGEYWHRGKFELDERKTLALIELGYRVVRVRENDLPHLAIEHPSLRQVSFRPTIGRADDVVPALLAWAAERV